METIRATYVTHPNAFSYPVDPKVESSRSAALWYAWGASDNEAILPSAPEHFAALYAEHVLRWKHHGPNRGMQFSIQSAFRRWLAREPIDLGIIGMWTVYDMNEKGAH